MNEEYNLGIGIRARIESVIEGEQEFEQTLQNIPTRIEQRIGNVINQPAFQEGLTPRDIKDLQDWAKYSSGLYNPLRKQLKQMAEDFEVDDSIGPLNKSQRMKHARRLAKLKGNLSDLTTDLTQDASQFGIDKERLPIIQAALRDASNEIGGDLDKLIQKFKSAKEESTGLLETLQKYGSLALAYNTGRQVLGLALSGELLTKQIEARYNTSFDLTSPISMYSEIEQAKLYERTAQREFEGREKGTLIGAGAGLLAGGVGLAFSGSPMMATALYWGAKSLTEDIFGYMAKHENTIDTGYTMAELKKLGQLFGGGTSLFQGASGYEKLITSLSSRFGTNMRGSSGLGFTADEEAQFKGMFGESLGRFDNDLYSSQLLFSRYAGLNPSSIFSLNQVSRLSGENYNASFLSNIAGLTKETFGQNSDNRRIVDVLENIRDIQMQMLKMGIETSDATRFGRIPGLILGLNSPFGRMGDLGMDTLSGLQRLGQPTNLAEEALLYRAIGGKGLFGPDGYLVRKSRGMLDSNNFIDILSSYARDFEGEPNAAQAFLSQKFQGLPPELMLKMSQLLSGGSIDVVTGRQVGQDGRPTSEIHEQLSLKSILKRFQESGDSAKEFKDIFGDLNGKISNWATLEEEIRNKNLSAARNFYDTISEGQKKSADFWQEMSNSAKAQSTMLDALDKGIRETIQFLITKGIISDPEKIKEEYNNQKYDAIFNIGNKLSGGRIRLLSGGMNLENYQNAMARALAEQLDTEDLEFVPSEKGNRLWEKRTKKLTGQDEINYYLEKFRKRLDKINTEEKGRLDKSTSSIETGDSANDLANVGNAIHSLLNRIDIILDKRNEVDVNIHSRDYLIDFQSRTIG